MWTCDFGCHGDQNWTYFDWCVTVYYNWDCQQCEMFQAVVTIYCSLLLMSVMILGYWTFFLLEGASDKIISGHSPEGSLVHFVGHFKNWDSILFTRGATIQMNWPNFWDIPTTPWPSFWFNFLVDSFFSGVLEYDSQRVNPPSCPSPRPLPPQQRDRTREEIRKLIETTEHAISQFTYSQILLKSHLRECSCSDNVMPSSVDMWIWIYRIRCDIASQILWDFEEGYVTILTLHWMLYQRFWPFITTNKFQAW